MQYFVSKTSPRAILVLFDRGDKMAGGAAGGGGERADQHRGADGGNRLVPARPICTPSPPPASRRRTSTGTSPAPSSWPASRARSSAETSTPTSPCSTGTASRPTSATSSRGARWPTGPRSAWWSWRGSRRSGTTTPTATSASARRSERHFEVRIVKVEIERGHDMDVKRVAVAGTGMMGPGIAATYALAGKGRRPSSGRTPEGAAKGMATAQGLVATLAANGLADPAEAKAAQGRFSTSCDPEAAARSVQLFVESIAENLAVKQAYFARLDAAAPDTILCSNTSGISITEIAAKCTRPERGRHHPLLEPPLHHAAGRGDRREAGPTSPSPRGWWRSFAPAARCPSWCGRDVPGQLGKPDPARHGPRVHAHRGRGNRLGRGRGFGGQGGRGPALPRLRRLRARRPGGSGAGQGRAGLRDPGSRQGAGRPPPSTTRRSPGGETGAKGREGVPGTGRPGRRSGCGPAATPS